MTPKFRRATLADISALDRLIAASARSLARADYSEAQIEAAIGTAWGVDSQLIRDETYFVAEVEGHGLVACGGWSRRNTLFGSDSHSGNESEALDPSRDPARIRAFFVHPDWARKGLGRALLQKCEEDAREHGFKSAVLIATLPGQRLYRLHGYVGEERVEYPVRGGLTIVMVPMVKAAM